MRQLAFLKDILTPTLKQNEWKISVAAGNYKRLVPFVKKFSGVRQSTLLLDILTPHTCAPEAAFAAVGVVQYVRFRENAGADGDYQKLCNAVAGGDGAHIGREIAQRNAQENGAQVRLVKSDCFAALAGEAFDMIVSNPPYIDSADMAQLMPEVLQEPHLALFGGEDGLDFYRRICREAGAYLECGGCLLFEIGYKQKDDVCALLREHIGEPFALKDYGDNWRVVGAVKK